MPEHHLLSSPERGWRAALTLSWPLALGGAPILLSLENLPLCAFRQLSGQPCPLCGGTHVCAALVEGNLVAAWQANPGVLPVLAIAAVQTFQLGYEAWSGRRVVRWRIGAGIWSLGGAWLVTAWLLRLLGQL